MNYSITNDKRNTLDSSLYIISCLICAALVIFIFSKISFNNESLNTIWIIFQCAFSISPVLFVFIFKIIFKKVFFKILNIPDLSGKYDVEIQSSFNKKTMSSATIEIKQTLNEIKVYFIALNSTSIAINAQIDNTLLHPRLYYMYQNDGKSSDKKNKSHIGSASINFIDNKIEGFYYNNGNDRQTQGTIRSVSKVKFNTVKGV